MDAGKRVNARKTQVMTRAAAFETVVGLIVIAVAAVFMTYAYGVSGKMVGRDQYRLGAVFGKVDGITIGSEVRIAGVKVGAVAANRLNTETYEADLQLVIDGNVLIPEDSIAKIQSDGILGSAHVAIEPGASEEMLREGDRITITRGSVDLLNLAVQAFTSRAGKNSTNNGESDEGLDPSDPLGDM